MWIYSNKILVGLLFLFLLSCVNKKSQSITKEVTVSVNKFDTLAYIKDIGQYLSEVDNKELDSISHDIYDSAEGGIKTVYFKNNDTLKKRTLFYGETGKRIITEYLKNSKVIFLKDIVISYRDPIYASQNVEIATKNVNEYYLNTDGTIIFWELNNKPKSQDEYKKQEINLPIE